MDNIKMVTRTSILEKIRIPNREKKDGSLIEDSEYPDVYIFNDDFYFDELVNIHLQELEEDNPLIHILNVTVKVNASPDNKKILYTAIIVYRRPVSR